MKDNFEIEKKFIIQYPDEDFLASLEGCTCSEIEQIYLKNSDKGVSERIRRRGSGGVYKYYYTEKKHITNMRRIENEKTITREEYDRLSRRADPELNVIRKKRYCIPYKNHILEIDVFPFWKSQAYLEIELSDENESYLVPDYIHIIRDVTEDKRFTNRSLSEGNTDILIV